MGLCWSESAWDRGQQGPGDRCPVPEHQHYFVGSDTVFSSFFSRSLSLLCLDTVIAHESPMPLVLWVQRGLLNTFFQQGILTAQKTWAFLPLE